MKYYIAFLFFTNFLCNSQILSGKVLDGTSNKPIEYANITFLKTDFGVATDQNGAFKIQLSNIKDQMQISALGYKTEIISLDKYIGIKSYNLDVILVPKHEELPEVIISKNKVQYSNPIRLGLRKKLKVRTSFPFGYEFSNYIKNPNSTDGIVQSVILSLNHANDFDHLATYNIKFYQYDEVLKCPGNELYFENIMLNPKNKTYDLKVDVKSLEIPFPANGICIAVEIINSNYNIEPKSMDKIAPKINFTHSDKDVLTWSRYRNKNWKIATTKSQMREDFVNAMINVVVKIEK